MNSSTRKKNEDNTDVKTFSSMAFVHLQLQHSSCTTHLTILHTVHNIEIFKLKFLSLIYCTQIWNPEKKKEKCVVTYVHYISGITNTYTTAYQKVQREKLHAGSVNHKSHFLFSLFGRDIRKPILFCTTQQYIQVHKTMKLANDCRLQ